MAVDSKFYARAIRPSHAPVDPMIRRPHECSVRAAAPDDAPCLAVLATQVWLHTYATEGVDPDIARYVLSELTVEKYAALIGNSDTRVFVAEFHASFVGFAVVNTAAQCPAASTSPAELQTLYVQEHFTGQGIGKLLLGAAEAEARATCGCALWLTVNARNARAIAFYAGRGYRKIGTDYFVMGNARHENHVLAGPEN